MSELLAQVQGGVGLLTLNRPGALNALSLPMIRDLTTVLLAWRDDDAIKAVAIRGMGKAGPFGVFCAGGDLRFFHRAVLAGDPALEDFFTEEYQLNHLIHTFPKPYLSFLDGVAMGGGLGIWGRAAVAAASASSPNAPGWPCRKPTSGCSPMSAAATSWGAARDGWASTWR